MTTALQTATIAKTYISPAASAALATTLLRGLALQGELYYANAASLANTLAAGCQDPAELVLAARIDTALQFGVHITEFGLLGYTSRLLAVGFNAQSVAGDQVRAITADDPIWLLWPWGRYDASHSNLLQIYLANGVAAMLAQNWARAIQHLQQAANQTANIAGSELGLVRQVLAANISLAVHFSHGGAR